MRAATIDANGATFWIIAEAVLRLTRLKVRCATAHSAMPAPRKIDISVAAASAVVVEPVVLEWSSSGSSVPAWSSSAWSSNQEASCGDRNRRDFLTDAPGRRREDPGIRRAQIQHRGRPFEIAHLGVDGQSPLRHSLIDGLARGHRLHRRRSKTGSRTRRKSRTAWRRRTECPVAPTAVRLPANESLPSARAPSQALSSAMRIDGWL